jgi:hypothetical protein
MWIIIARAGLAFSPGERYSPLSWGETGEKRGEIPFCPEKWQKI